MMVTDLHANPGQIEPRIIFQLLAQQRIYTFIWKLCVCVYVYISSGSSILSPVNSFVLLLLLWTLQIIVP